MTNDDLPGLVDGGVQRTLELARTWLAGAGPASARTRSGSKRRTRPGAATPTTCSPPLECLLAEVATVPDGWRGSFVTLETDWAHFTEADLDEARQRLLRLALLYRTRLTAIGADEWERGRGDDEWTIRQIVEHVAEPWYAEQVGDLSRQ